MFKHSYDGKKGEDLSPKTFLPKMHFQRVFSFLESVTYVTVADGLTPILILDISDKIYDCRLLLVKSNNNNKTTKIDKN